MTISLMLVISTNPFPKKKWGELIYEEIYLCRKKTRNARYIIH